MGKEQVMDYVMNSPENTNSAILGNMLDSLGGEVETTVIFEDDITLTYRKGSYGPDSAIIDSNYFTSSPFTEVGFIIVTFDNFKILSAVNGGTSFDPHFNFHADEQDYYVDSGIAIHLIVDMFYDPQEEKYTLQGGMTSNMSDHSALNEYCQTPHHLKIEFLKI